MNGTNNTSGQAARSRVVLIDGLIFQFYQGAPNGISRVWLNLIPHLQEKLPDHSLVVVRRGRFSSGLPGIQEQPFPEYDFNAADGGEADSLRLGDLAARLGAGCFLSTYYSRAAGCPSILLVHDMIPEVMGEDLTRPAWVAKRKAIEAASAFIAVSDSTRRDLSACYPVGERPVTTAHNGVSPGFTPAPPAQVEQFLEARKLRQGYLLLVGGRGQYKGATRFLRALLESGLAGRFPVVAVGGEPWLTPEEEALRKRLNITYTGWISDSDLRLLYAGAFALVYPSRYEGFGLPVAEAMACGCPAILPRHSSLPEVAGDAGVYADPGNAAELAAALHQLLEPVQRAALVEAGLKQSARFRWPAMADAFRRGILALEGG